MVRLLSGAPGPATLSSVQLRLPTSIPAVPFICGCSNDAAASAAVKEADEDAIGERASVSSATQAAVALQEASHSTTDCTVST